MFNLISFLEYGGYLGITGIIFAESGLLIGFFLPGDSVLFTAGFLASQGIFNIWLLILLTFLAAAIGDSVGYAFGFRVGRNLFNRPNSLLFDKHHLQKAEAFYEKHGGKTIILARFLPIIRTFVPILAGVGTMNYRKFITYNLVGGLLWAVGLPLLGYTLGATIPNVDHYLLPIIVVIIGVSLLPSVWHVLRTKEDRERVVAMIKQAWQKVTRRVTQN